MCVFNTLIAHLKNGLAGVRHLVEEFSSCLSPFFTISLALTLGNRRSWSCKKSTLGRLEHGGLLEIDLCSNTII